MVGGACVRSGGLAVLVFLGYERKNAMSPTPLPSPGALDDGDCPAFLGDFALLRGYVGFLSLEKCSQNV